MLPEIDVTYSVSYPYLDPWPCAFGRVFDYSGILGGAGGRRHGEGGLVAGDNGDMDRWLMVGGLSVGGWLGSQPHSIIENCDRSKDRGAWSCPDSIDDDDDDNNNNKLIILLRIIPLYSYSGFPSTQNNLLPPEIPINSIYSRQSLPLHAPAYSMHRILAVCLFLFSLSPSISIISMIFCTQASLLNVHTNLNVFP